MSAYIVNPETIARLATYGGYTYDFPPKLDTEEAINLAGLLIDENIRSIACRYPDTKGHEVKDFMGCSEKEYRNKITALILNPMNQRPRMEQIAQDLPEYDYQACESEDYYDTRAYKALTDIAMKFVRQYRDKQRATV